MAVVNCFHCGVEVDTTIVHTDEIDDNYFVESCEECCMICQSGRDSSIERE